MSALDGPATVVLPAYMEHYREEESDVGFSIWVRSDQVTRAKESAQYRLRLTTMFAEMVRGETGIFPPTRYRPQIVLPDEEGYCEEPDGDPLNLTQLERKFH
ncbi:MAG TPA: hypothetical protein VM103_00330 [Candidatus Paceibacterota bacterium]|nr:hypothetical protein [Candidatus Paceibacterota bacterium]